MTCDWWYRVDCEKSSTWYDQNAKLFPQWQQSRRNRIGRTKSDRKSTWADPRRKGLKHNDGSRWTTTTVRTRKPRIFGLRKTTLPSGWNSDKKRLNSAYYSTYFTKSPGDQSTSSMYDTDKESDVDSTTSAGKLPKSHPQSESSSVYTSEDSTISKNEMSPKHPSLEGNKVKNYTEWLLKPSTHSKSSPLEHRKTFYEHTGGTNEPPSVTENKHGINTKQNLSILKYTPVGYWANGSPAEEQNSKQNIGGPRIIKLNVENSPVTDQYKPEEERDNADNSNENNSEQKINAAEPKIKAAEPKIKPIWYLDPENKDVIAKAVKKSPVNLWKKFRELKPSSDRFVQRGNGKDDTSQEENEKVEDVKKETEIYGGRRPTVAKYELRSDENLDDYSEEESDVAEKESRDSHPTTQSVQFFIQGRSPLADGPSGYSKSMKENPVSMFGSKTVIHDNRATGPSRENVRYETETPPSIERRPTVRGIVRKINRRPTFVIPPSTDSKGHTSTVSFSSPSDPVKRMNRTIIASLTGPSRITRIIKKRKPIPATATAGSPDGQPPIKATDSFWDTDHRSGGWKSNPNPFQENADQSNSAISQVHRPSSPQRPTYDLEESRAMSSPDDNPVVKVNDFRKTSEEHGVDGFTRTRVNPNLEIHKGRLMPMRTGSLSSILDQKGQSRGMGPISKPKLVLLDNKKPDQRKNNRLFLTPFMFPDDGHAAGPRALPLSPKEKQRLRTNLSWHFPQIRPYGQSMKAKAQTTGQQIPKMNQNDAIENYNLLMSLYHARTLFRNDKKPQTIYGNFSGDKRFQNFPIVRPYSQTSPVQPPVPENGRHPKNYHPLPWDNGFPVDKFPVIRPYGQVTSTVNGEVYSYPTISGNRNSRFRKINAYENLKSYPGDLGNMQTRITLRPNPSVMMQPLPMPSKNLLNRPLYAQYQRNNYSLNSKVRFPNLYKKEVLSHETGEESPTYRDTRPSENKLLTNGNGSRESGLSKSHEKNMDGVTKTGSGEEIVPFLVRKEHATNPSNSHAHRETTETENSEVLSASASASESREYIDKNHGNPTSPSAEKTPTKKRKRLYNDEYRAKRLYNDEYSAKRLYNDEYVAKLLRMSEENASRNQPSVFLYHQRGLRVNGIPEQSNGHRQGYSYYSGGGGGVAEEIAKTNSKSAKVRPDFRRLPLRHNEDDGHRDLRSGINPGTNPSDTSQSYDSARNSQETNAGRTPESEEKGNYAELERIAEQAAMKYMQNLKKQS